MLEYVFAGLTGLIEAGAMSLAFGHAKSVRGVLRADAEDLVTRLKRAAPEKRLALLAEANEAAGPSNTLETMLAEALTGAESDQAKVAATNEALVDLSLRLESRKTWGPSAPRIAFFGGVLSTGLMRLTWGVETPWSLELKVLLCVSGLFTLIGVVISHLVQDKTKSLERVQRSSVDGLVQALVPGAPREPSRNRRFG